MLRKHLLVRTFGLALMLGVSPLVALGQTTTTTTTPTTTTSPTTQGGGTQSQAQGIAAVESLTQKLSITSAQGSAGSATTIPSNSNIYALTYVNPMSLGLPDLYKTQFGAQNTITKQGGPKGKFTYLYVAPTTTTSSASTAAQQAAGFTTYGTPRSPVYTTGLSPDMPLVQHESSKLFSDVRALVDRSSFLKNSKDIVVRVDGNTVVLSGQVGSEKERRMAEGMARMTPGVFDVQNSLTVIELKK